jgi:hypothetical protein
MIKSVCFSCGTPKKQPAARCDNCGVVPTSKIERAKSIYLSRDRFAGCETEEPAEHQQQLLLAQRVIQAGGSFAYDDAELERILATEKLVRQVPLSAAWLALFRFFLPGLLLLVGLGIVYWILRSLRPQ